MKLKEGTKDNIEVLRDCLNLILDDFPNIIPSQEIIIRHVSDMSGIGLLISKYKGTKYEAGIETFFNTVIKYINTSNSNRNVYGSYSSSHNISSQLYVNISSFMGYVDSFKKQTLLNYRRDDLPVKTIKAILGHEIRHLFQSQLFTDHYYTTSNNAYDTKSIEVDAAWFHNLKDFDTSSYSSVSQYVFDVMDSFSKYKKLTTKQYVHYRKKTAQHYFNETSGNKDIPSFTSDAGSRLKLKREKTKAMILNKLAKVNSDFDMRELPNYGADFRMFFLPARIFKSVAATLSKTREELKTLPATPIFLTLAILLDDEELDLAARYIRSTYQLTIRNALEKFDDYIPAVFDREAIRNFLIDKYM